MAVTITRTVIVDDDGSLTTGTIWNNAWKTELYNQIDAVTAALPVNGTSLTAHGVVIGEGTSAVAVTSAGTAGQVLTSNGASADPTFQSPTVDVGVCEGRLTLTTAVPVTTADVTGAASIFLAPYKGSRIALYDGANWQIYTFTEKTLALGTLINAQAYDVFAFVSAGVVTLEALEWANATVTMTIAAPGVVTWTAHGMATGNSITFTNSGGALPTGVTANTQYWITVVDANTFKLSTTLANVSALTYITTSGSQSGTHTGHQPQARATALVMQDGVLSKTGALTRRYIGTFLTTATTTTEDSYAKRFVWNYYNRVRRGMRVIESTDSWTYTTGAFRQTNASAANQLAVVVGVADAAFEGVAFGLISNTNAGVTPVAGIGENSTSAKATGCVNLFGSTAAGGFAPTSAALRTFPAIGYNAYVWLEFSSAVGTSTWYGDNGGAFIQSGIIATIEG